MTRQRRWAMTGLVAAAALALAACSSQSPPPPPSTSSAPSITQAPAPTPSAAPVTDVPLTSAPPVHGPTLPGKPLRCNAMQPTWSNAAQHGGMAITGTSLPILNSIATAAQSPGGYDRLTFDFLGPVPTYDIKYVPQVVQDGSGKTLTVPGEAYLQVVFHGANAHFEDGTTPPALKSAATLRYPRLQAYQLNGDFEGTVSVALGVKACQTGFRHGELPGQTHSRLYVDVQY
jgi:hypothetical protein